MTGRVPMFPLGSVLLPHMLLPLHVFEPRYRVLFEELVGELPRPDDQAGLGDEPRFGVALIERGSEVGGGEQRAELGTLATVVGARMAEDGRWAIAAVGGERIQVLDWLDDDPYPRAEVEVWPDQDPPGTADTLAGAIPALRDRHGVVLELLTQLGMSEEPEALDWTGDPVGLIWQVALSSPLGSHDRYQLLAASGSAERVHLLAGQLDEQADLLRARLT